MSFGDWGIVLTGGSAPEKDRVTFLLERAALLVGADAGLDLADDYGCTPDFVVGDMDSVKRSGRLAEIDPERVIRHSHNKDETDTELGIEVLRRRDIDKIAVIGGGGGRLDHLIAILALFDRPDSPNIWISHNAFVLNIVDTCYMKGCGGERISFFPAGNTTVTMRSDGLEWELNGLAWNHGDVGISNRMRTNDVSVEVLTGRLIMVGELGVLSGVVL